MPDVWIVPGVQVKHESIKCNFGFSPAGLNTEEKTERNRHRHRGLHSRQEKRRQSHGNLRQANRRRSGV